MDHQLEPEPSDPTLRVTRDVYYMLVHDLRGTLLPPVNDTPEERARRDHAAIAQVAAMLPGNADEATAPRSASPPGCTRWTASAWRASSPRLIRCGPASAPPKATA